MSPSAPPVPHSPPRLDPIAMAALDVGRMMMETEASGDSVEEIVKTVALGLGAEQVELRIGFDVLAITIGAQEATMTRMRSVGHRGVNMRLQQALWRLAERVSRGELRTELVHAELTRLANATPRHSAWVMALAVGLACAAFGRLLGVDWYGAGPVFVAAAIGQYLRRVLITRRVNAFICATVVSFTTSMLASLGARAAGSGTITMAVIASVLLLVPGVPAVNAQNDILEGHPTLGSARAMTVLMTLIFVAAGLWIGPVQFDLWH